MAESEFERIRAEYLHRLSRQLHRVPPSLREDALHEVEAHIEDATRPAPGDVAVLTAVLEKLGPPEEYGHDLGLQLLLQANRRHPSLGLLVWIGFFWATSSIIGALVVIGAAISYVFGLCFLIDGLIRLLDPTATITMIRINDTNLIPAWPPLANLAIGILVLYLLTYGLIFLVRRWSISRLNRQVLASTLDQEKADFPSDWGRRVTGAILLTAILGFLGCSIFGAVGGLLPIGQFGSMSLPQDFFKNPLTFLSFIGGIAFLLSPVLGILWVAWKEQQKDRHDQGGPTQEKN